MSKSTKVAIFVPGILGSVLKNKKNEVVWPGPLSTILGPYADELMRQLMSDELEATDIIRKVAIKNIYQPLLDQFKFCGFDSEDNGTKRNLYLCHYDWRKDNRISAERLATIIENEVMKEHDQDVEIILIGHSMGGLVSRYYMESGKFNNRSGFSNVKMFIALATPHNGAYEALLATQGKLSKGRLSKEQVKELGSDSRFPSLYQLLPPKGEPFVWTNGTHLAPVDIYEDVNVEKLKLSRENLRSNKELYDSIKERAKHVRYFSFVGTEMQTICGIKVTESEGKFVVEKHLVKHGGDGTVPSNSASSLAGVQMMPVRGEHGAIFRSYDLQRAFHLLLGKTGVLDLGNVAYQITVKDSVIADGSDVVVILQPLDAKSTITGEFSVKQLDINTGTEIKEVKKIPISYAGAKIESLQIDFECPKEPGLYKVEFIDMSGVVQSNFDDFFVQRISII